MAPETDDPYESLRARIRATQDAVDRLADETARAREEAAEAGVRTEDGEPSGGAAAGPPPSGEEAQEEIRALVALVELLRDVLPPDLRAQLAELVRQLLIILRAILDWWIERIDPVRASGAGHAEPPVVEDIEIS